MSNGIGFFAGLKSLRSDNKYVLGSAITGTNAATANLFITLKNDAKSFQMRNVNLGSPIVVMIVHPDADSTTDKVEFFRVENNESFSYSTFDSAQSFYLPAQTKIYVYAISTVTPTGLLKLFAWG